MSETTTEPNDTAAALALRVVPQSIEQAMERYSQMRALVRSVMRQNVDYGVIPGTGSKSTLLKPGAEKLLNFFSLSALLSLVEKTEEWDKGLFAYTWKCDVTTREGRVVASAMGSCNSYESKYRWRKAERVCPACGKPAIIKGKPEYGGGWLCFKKKNGCGAKFGDNDPAITSQPDGRSPNPDPADQVNTIMKMGQKRAYIAATLLAVAASEFFTQDMEDAAGIEESEPERPMREVVDVQTGEVRTVEEPEPPYEIETFRADVSIWALANGWTQDGIGLCVKTKAHEAGFTPWTAAPDRWRRDFARALQAGQHQGFRDMFCKTADAQRRAASRIKGDSASAELDALLPQLKEADRKEIEGELVRVENMESLEQARQRVAELLVMVKGWLATPEPSPSPAAPVDANDSDPAVNHTGGPNARGRGAKKAGTGAAMNAGRGG